MPRYKFGPFDLDPEARLLCRDGEPIPMTGRMLDALVVLVERRGRLVDKEELLSRIWAGSVVEEANLTQAIFTLRKILGDSPKDRRYIATIAGRGYQFVAPVTVASPDLNGSNDNGRSTSGDEARAIGRKTRLVPTIVVSGFLVVLAGLLVIWLRSGRKSEPVVPTPLTAAEGSEDSPSFSPDGSQVVYSWNLPGKGSNSRLFTKVIGSGRPVQLTAPSGSDYKPAWSPDGRNVAFIRVTGGPNASVYLIAPLGGTERKLVDGYLDGKISWSTDSSSLAIAQAKSEGQPTSLYLVSTETGIEVKLTSSSDLKIRDIDPAFSPDGRHILFTRCNGPYYCALYLLDLTVDYRSSGEPRLLRQEGDDVWGCDWTADGKEVVYAVSDDGGFNHHLMRIRVDAKSLPERLSYTGERTGEPALARGRNRLAYVQDLGDIDIWQVQVGSAPRSFLSSTRFETTPQYSPDGKHIAFGSNRSGVMQIWVCNAVGEDLVQLTHSDRLSGTPTWSPDGHWIAFDRDLKEGWRIFIMPSDGGPAHRLTPDTEHENLPSWSRNGEWVYYASNRTGRSELWKAPAHGGKRIQITRNGGFAAFESVDGRRLYYVKSDDSGLWTMPVDGGSETLLIDSVSQRAFVVGADGIYYIPNARPDGSTSLMFHDFATAANREITRIDQPVFEGLTVSPDEKTILFPVVSRSTSNIMLVENFPLGQR